MTDSAIPILLTIAVAVVTAGAMLGLSFVLGRPKKSIVDRTPYECGFRPFDPIDKHRFSVKFYLVAMLFILFDIEVAFLVPWAVTLAGLGEARTFSLVAMTIFLAALEAGFLYIWWRGALEWE
jgi:NADH-quinone oxidoreductase subunit A